MPATPTTRRREPTSDADDDEDLPPIPWHLWLLAGALAVYLGYRAMQGIEWLLGTISSALHSRQKVAICSRY